MCQVLTFSENLLPLTLHQICEKINGSRYCFSLQIRCYAESLLNHNMYHEVTKQTQSINIVL